MAEIRFVNLSWPFKKIFSKGGRSYILDWKETYVFVYMRRTIIYQVIRVEWKIREEGRERQISFKVEGASNCLWHLLFLFFYLNLYIFFFIPFLFLHLREFLRSCMLIAMRQDCYTFSVWGSLLEASTCYMGLQKLQYQVKTAVNIVA